MWRVTLKGLWAHKRRLISSLLSVFLGVAFLAGTMMLSDTISKTFDDLFAGVYADTDAVVRSAEKIDGEFGGDDLRGRIDASLVDEVRDVDGVDAAEGSVEGYAQIVGKDGEALGQPGQGPPTFGAGWGEVDELNPFKLSDGGPPGADDEVVIDAKSAKDGELEVGDTVTILTKEPPAEFTVAGIARFGDADSPGGASFAMFTPETAEQLLGEPGKVNSIGVVGEGAISQTELRDNIADALPGSVEVLTGDEITEETQSDIADALSFFSIFLGVFAAVGMLVAIFSIYNAFSIIVAQRTREMALLRAVGASRRQVLGTVVLEAAVGGILASLLGLAGGALMVSGLKAMLDAFGLDLPAGGLVLKPSTIIVSLGLGLAITVVSAVGPAVRASRVPPIAALRDVEVDRAARSRWRIALGSLVLLLGVGATFAATSGGGDEALIAAGGGVLLILFGTIIFGPVVARPLGRLLGAPIRRVRGVTGRLAQENASRNPKRTANTAAALLVGVGVVGFFTIIAASIRHSIESTIDKSVSGDFVVDSGSFGMGGGLSPELASDLNELDEVDVATGMRASQAEIDGSNEFLFAIDDATFDQVVDTEVIEGSLDQLGTDGIAVFSDKAADEGWALGDKIPMRFAETGEAQFTIAAIYDSNEVVGNYLLGHEGFEANIPDQLDAQVYVNLAEGVTPDEGRGAIESVAEAYPQAEVQDQEEFKDSQAAQIDQLLGLVYAMLAFAVMVAFMGIANTLSLSIHERTRELGLMRAVGMSRRQLRSSVRWESVIIAVFGTLGGLAIAVFFSWVAVTAVDEEGLTFSLPVGSLAMVVVVAAFFGVLAAIRPARRAGRLDILQAIATE